MANLFNVHFREFIKALNDHEVEYVLVGGMAVILHGYIRGTGDMDIWVNKTKDNFRKRISAYKQFGMPVFDLTEEAFLGENLMFGVSVSSLLKLKS